MKEEIVGKVVAKLAKEKGFNEWCNDSYTEAKCDIYINKIVRFSKGYYYHEQEKHKNSIDGIDDSEYWISYSAPTQSFLKMWLRIRYHLDVRVAINSLTCYFPMISLIDIDGTQMKGPVYKNHKSYEKAMEAGLHEALLLIGKKDEKDIKLFD